MGGFFSLFIFYLYLFRLLYWCSIPLLWPRVNFTFWEQSCPIGPFLEWLGVAGKAYGQGPEYGLVRRRTQCYCVGRFFPYPAPYTQFAPFFGHFGEVPSRWSSSTIVLLGLGRGPGDKLGLGQGHNFFGPTIFYLKYIINNFLEEKYESKHSSI